MMYAFEDIKHVHLEISSKCNAECPLCPRSFFGYPIDRRYFPEHNMTVEEARKIFPPEFVRQLKWIEICGNFGDLVMNPYTVEICEYFKSENRSVVIEAHTNAGGRDSKFWQDLARLRVLVYFDLDGLEDTHAIYRKNTVFATVMKNAQTFIKAGGYATWKMIKFEHNQHQIQECERLSSELGFSHFILIDNGRDCGPSFNREKKIEFFFKPDQWHARKVPTDFDILYDGHFDPAHTQSSYEKYKKQTSSKRIECRAIQDKSIYVSSIGEVFPCCWTGMHPRTFTNNSDHGFGMNQIKNLMAGNNALENDLRDCVKWFDSVEENWHQSSYGEGRLIVCDMACGKDQ